MKQRIKLLRKWLYEHRNDYDIVHVHCCHALAAWIHVVAAKKSKIKVIWKFWDLISICLIY